MRRSPLHLGVLLFIAAASLALVLGALSLVTGARGLRFDLSCGRIEQYVELFGREVYCRDVHSPLYDTYLKYVGQPQGPPDMLLIEWHPIVAGANVASAEAFLGPRERLLPLAAEVLADTVEGRSSTFNIPRGNRLSLECRKQLLLRGLELLRDAAAWPQFPRYMADCDRRLNAAATPATELDLPVVQQFLGPQFSAGGFPPYLAQPPPIGDPAELLRQAEQQYRSLMRGYGKGLPSQGSGFLYRDPISGQWQSLEDWDVLQRDGSTLGGQTDGPMLAY